MAETQDEYGVLTVWQEAHGELDPKWHQAFISHPLMYEILSHPWDHVAVAVRRNKRLEEVLADLRNQVEKTEAFLDKWRPYRNSKPDPSPRNSEYDRRGQSWSDLRDWE